MPTLPGNFLLGQAVHELDIEHLPSMISHGTNGFQRNLQKPWIQVEEGAVNYVGVGFSESDAEAIQTLSCNSILSKMHTLSYTSCVKVSVDVYRSGTLNPTANSSSVRVSSVRFFGSSAGTCCSKSETLLQI